MRRNDSPHTKRYAFIADEDIRAGHQLQSFALGPPAKRAADVPRHRRFPSLPSFAAINRAPQCRNALWPFFRASRPMPSNRQQAVAKPACPRSSSPDPPPGGSAVLGRDIPLACWSYAATPRLKQGNVGRRTFQGGSISRVIAASAAPVPTVRPTATRSPRGHVAARGSRPREAVALVKEKQHKAKNDHQHYRA